MADSLTTRILIEIRDELRSTKHELGSRIDHTNEKLAVLAKITQGIDTRLTRMETRDAFLPRRVDVLEEKVDRLELALVSRG